MNPGTIIKVVIIFIMAVIGAGFGAFSIYSSRGSITVMLHDTWGKMAMRALCGALIGAGFAIFCLMKSSRDGRRANDDPPRDKDGWNL